MLKWHCSHCDFCKDQTHHVEHVWASRVRPHT